MLNKQRFKEQINLMSTHYLRRVPPELMREYWTRFKEKEQKPWDKAIDDVLQREERFPVIALLQSYYEANLSQKEETLWPTRQDLKRQAKAEKHKHYLKLIRGFLDEDSDIDIEDPRVQKCLDEQGDERIFLSYDSTRRAFRKPWRHRVSDVMVTELRKILGVKSNSKFKAKEFRKKWGKD